MRAVVVTVASVIVSVFLGVPGVARADPCVNGTVSPGGPGGDVFMCLDRGWVHVVPYGANGYGPDQPLPPGCTRFADKFMCPVDGPASG